MDGGDEEVLVATAVAGVAPRAQLLASGVPDEGVLALAAGAVGNPLLLTGLISGLREEDTIRVAGGRAVLASAELSQRIGGAAWLWLDGLSRDARRLLGTAGLTNRQAADRMFTSVHTIVFHLRQAFRKLTIGSRVELARIVMERSRHAVHVVSLSTLHGAS
jgi:DNA-binding CsgD family transcriptional regulator